MRYDYVLQTPCPQCQAPVLSFTAFCCSDTVRRECRKCGLKDSIPSKEYWALEKKVAHASNVTGSVFFSKYIFMTEQEITKRDAFRKEWREKHPGEHSMIVDHDDGNLKLIKLTDKEAAVFAQQMIDCGITSLSAGQIGFVGDRQAFDKPWKTAPDVKVTVL